MSEARRAVEVGEIPVVMSGDGLIGQIGGALANSGSPLGIIPGGRGNDLARVLGIPSEPAGSVATLAEGHVREIDVGEANGRRFLGIASCGFDSDANRIANEARLIRGNLVYAYAALRALAAWRHARFTITLDGSRTIELVGYSVVVANSRAYGGGMFIAPDAELDDGKFDVVLTGEAGKLRFSPICPRCSRARMSRTRRSSSSRLRGGGRGRSGLRRLRGRGPPHRPAGATRNAEACAAGDRPAAVRLTCPHDERFLRGEQGSHARSAESADGAGGAAAPPCRGASVSPPMRSRASPLG